MNELENSKRLRTDDGDNLPVTGPGGQKGKRIQHRCIEPHCSFNYSPPDCPTCHGSGCMFSCVTNDTHDER
jgi:hypothetical protein